MSRIEFPYWYWTQTQIDEIQEIDFGNLADSVGLKLKFGERSTSDLFPSSDVDTIAAAIMGLLSKNSF